MIEDLLKHRHMLAYYNALHHGLNRALQDLPGDVELTVGEQLHVMATMVGHTVASTVSAPHQDEVLRLLGVAMREACMVAKVVPLAPGGTA